MKFTLNLNDVYTNLKNNAELSSMFKELFVRDDDIPQIENVLQQDDIETAFDVLDSIDERPDDSLQFEDGYVDQCIELDDRKLTSDNYEILITATFPCDVKNINKVKQMLKEQVAYAMTEVHAWTIADEFGDDKSDDWYDNYDDDPIINSIPDDLITVEK